MLTWLNGCIEIGAAFQSSKPFPVTAELEGPDSSLYYVNQRFAILGCRCRVLDSSVVTDNSMVSGPQPASAAAMAALSWAKAQHGINDRKKVAIIVLIDPSSFALTNQYW
jgi:hypothetical protein